jgi:hypothetical protein
MSRNKNWGGLFVAFMGFYMFTRLLTVLTSQDTAALSQIGSWCTPHHPSIFYFK